MTLPFLGSFGCSKLLGIPDDPQFTEGGAGGNVTDPELPDNWRCVLDGSQTVEIADSAEVRIRICDYGTPCAMTSTASLTGTLCNKLDCSVPIEDALEPVDGYFDLELDLTGYEEGFDGYLRIADTDYAQCKDEEAFGELADGTLCEIIGCPDPDSEACISPIHIPTIYTLTPPVTGNDTLERFVDAVRIESAYTILDYAGAVLEDNNAFMLQTVVLDCNGEPASGVELSVNADGHYLAYEQDGVFNSQGTMTSSTGSAAFFNLPPRYIIVTAKVNGITVSTAATTMEPYSVSFVTLRAEPAE